LGARKFGETVIHLILIEPIAYQRTLCRTLDERYDGAFTAWFAARDIGGTPYEPETEGGFQSYYLSDVGYGKLFRALMADRDALIILGGWSAPMTSRTLLFATLLRIPVFIWADHPHPRRRSWVKERLRRLVVRLMTVKVTGFLACGQPTVVYLESLGIAPEQITNFPYWVDVPEHWSYPERSNTQFESRPLRLLAAGRQAPVKQFEIAIRAVAIANDKRAGSVELMFAGDGPERAKLEALAASLNCKEAIRFTGWLRNSEVFAELERSDALVLTSKFDAYGAVVLEAMAMGRAILASDGVVAALDRRQGDAIFLHPAGDAPVLADQIQLLARDPELLRRASIAARTVAEQWRPARAVAILDGLLLKTVRGKRLLKNRYPENAVDPTLASKGAARLTLEG
jgi:glycosyltransferase involved in cell wall biosynthesis